MPREFPVGILARELPVNSTTLLIAPLLPSQHFGAQARLVGDPASDALAIQNANLDLRHVEPTGMLWGVVKFQPRKKNRRRFQPHDRLEGGAKMRVLVVQNQMDFTGL